MPKRNSDQSKSKVIKLPKLHANSNAVDIWFEAGMIHFEDPSSPNDVTSCTLIHFKAFIETLREYADDDEMVVHFVCGRQAIRRFVDHAWDLIREVEPQLHVGLPIETIAEVEASRAGIAVRPGFESPLTSNRSSDPLGFSQRESGLIVPN
jgi:hypothetical protein